MWDSRTHKRDEFQGKKTGAPSRLLTARGKPMATEEAILIPGDTRCQEPKTVLQSWQPSAWVLLDAFRI
jgi:hypothetical protein